MRIERSTAVAYLSALGAVAVATGFSRAFFWRDRLPDVVMVYLLGIVTIALRFGRGPSLAAAALSVPTLDYFFVPPYFSFAVSDLKYVVTFAMMCAVAFVVSSLAERVREQARAAEAERMRSSLLSSVSHDLRTPLSVITGSASALIDDDARLGAEARRDLAVTIQEEAQRLNRLVRNLLDMTRIASGAIQVSKDWQPLDGVLGAALGRVEDLLEGRAVDVVLPQDPPLVPIDAVLIEQVLINLLENAAKYTPRCSPLSIAARDEEGSIVVDVSDRGPGIPTELADKIFEKFYRLRRDGAAGGAGLGLAICRGIVRAHGGEIAALAREGGGATFRFTIPLEGEPPIIDAESGAEGERPAEDA
jgi:two-component system sensor histidine kinase KdpD